MKNNIFFPWNEAPMRRWLSAQAQGMAGHAWLFEGPAGSGKLEFVRALAGGSLCEIPMSNGLACGQCASCKLIGAGNHPDLRVIRPALLAAAEGVGRDAEDDDEIGSQASSEPVEVSDASAISAKKKLSREISIRQIRELSEFAAIASTRGGRRVCMIYPAESMATAAANALLKTLEEPTPGLQLFLLSDEPARLLPTIRSRCQHVAMPLPEREAALAWLTAECGRPHSELADQLDALGGAPLEVIRLSQSVYWEIKSELIEGLSRGSRMDVLGMAKQLELHVRKNEKERQAGEAHVLDLKTIVDWLQRWVHDTVLMRNSLGIRYHPKQSAQLEVLSEIELSRLHEYARWLNNAAVQALHPVNNLLFLEDCLLRYRALF